MKIILKKVFDKYNFNLYHVFMKYSKEKNTIAKQIKEKRERLGISQKEMGKILGMAGQAYCLYETGINNPPAWKYLIIMNLKKKDLK